MPSEIECNPNTCHRPVLGVCAPSRALCTPSLDGTVDVDRIEAAARFFREMGWEILEADNIRSIDQRFAGTDESRVNGIESLFSNPDVDCIMALRGGYGASRILGMLDYAKIVRSNAPLIGFSDVTALELAMLAKCSKPSWQGPSFSAYATRDANRDRGLKTVFEGGPWQADFKTESEVDLDLQGMLWGGNLSILTSLVGTAYLPDIEGGILLLEDVAEPSWRIERMLLTLEHAGILHKQKALVLGEFTHADKGAGEGNARFTLQDAIEYIGRRTGLPIISGLRFGHIETSLTVPIGVDARLTVQGRQATLLVERPPKPIHVPYAGNWWN